MNCHPPNLNGFLSAASLLSPCQLMPASLLSPAARVQKEPAETAPLFGHIS